MSGVKMTPELAQVLLEKAGKPEGWSAFALTAYPGEGFVGIVGQEAVARVSSLDLAPIMALGPDLARAYLAERIVSSALEVRIDDLTLERDRLAHELRLLREAVRPAPLSDHRRKNAEAVCGALTGEWQSTLALWRASGLKYGTVLSALRDAVVLGWAERQKPAAKATKAFFRLAPLCNDTPERSGGEG